MKITRNIFGIDIDIELTKQEIESVQEKNLIFSDEDFALAYIERHNLYGNEEPSKYIQECLTEYASKINDVKNLWMNELDNITIDDTESISSMLNHCVDAVSPNKKYRAYATRTYYSSAYFDVEARDLQDARNMA